MIENKKNEEIWFCVDSDGEKMFKGIEPLRWKAVARIPQDIELWTGVGEEGVDYEIVNLPSGFIKKLFNLNLGWHDNPVKCDLNNSWNEDPLDKLKRYNGVKKGLTYSYEDTDAFLKTLMDDPSTSLSPSRFLNIISSFLDQEEKRTCCAGFIQLKCFKHIAVYGKYYACLDKTGKLCRVKAGSDEWDNNVSYVNPRMDLGVLSDMLYNINNPEENE